MKNLTQVLIALFCLCMPALLYAQKDDSKYLAGAVPEVDGKVVFTKDFSIPGMSQDTIYARMLRWMSTKLAQNENNSRVVFADKKEKLIVGIGDEWMVFSSTALSLDRTKILYSLSAICLPEKCTLEVEKIRFSYRDGKEKYTAEEWITDRYALNKSKTKLVRGLAKWRRKTVDFVDALCVGAAEALSATTAKAPATEEKKEETKALVNSGTTVIIPKAQVTVESSQQPSSTTAPATRKAETGTYYKEVAASAIPANAVQPGNGKLVIVIGEEPFNMTMMTANAGGSLGKVNNSLPVVFTILSPDQAHEQMDQAATYTVRFYPNGEKEPSLILECKKYPAQAPIEGMPRTYIGEIVKAKMKTLQEGQ